MRAVKDLVNALTPQKKVFILGSAFVDMILSVHEMPHAGADIEGKFKKTVVGGCSFSIKNIAYSEKRFKIIYLQRKGMTSDRYEVSVI